MATTDSTHTGHTGLSSVASRIGRVLSPERHHDDKERSQSRGREAFVSSGRGGAGNIHRSISRDARGFDGPDDFSPTRGRELAQSDSITHTGRGGAGNVRSPSRDPEQRAREAKELEREKEILAGRQAEYETPISTGRGGAGNITTDRSRSRSRPPPGAVVSSGRGGYGNITAEHGDLQRLEEEERKGVRHEEGPHYTGRGGAGNLTSAHSSIDRPHHTHPTASEYVSSGRGGAGNIHHPPSGLRGEVVDAEGFRARGDLS